jgi:hypothetical protein
MHFVLELEGKEELTEYEENHLIFVRKETKYIYIEYLGIDQSRADEA